MPQQRSEHFRRNGVNRFAAAAPVSSEQVVSSIAMTPLVNDQGPAILKSST